MLRASVVLGCWGVVCALLAQEVDVAILQSREGGFYADAVQRFHQELEKQGVSAQTLTFALKGDRSDQDLPRRILERKPAVILAVGTDAALLLKAHYEKLPPAQQVPVVFTMVVDPVGQGLIRDVERSGARFAGVALAVRPLRQLRVLQDIKPDIKRVGVLYNPKDPVSQRILAQAREDAARLNLSLQEAPLEQPAQMGTALQLLAGKVDALWLIPDPVCAAPEPSQQVLEFAHKNRIVVLAFSDSFVRRGALVGAGVDMAEQGTLAAEQVVRILNGEKPEDLPLLTPRRALTYYNLKTARALGVTIPDMLLNLAERCTNEATGLARAAIVVLRTDGTGARGSSRRATL
ncbi:MAG: ABC transporter substrate-binding protein [Fimbriimonadales bacterium]|nr:ABC transporter substrate-binding protein [Fimbriimonadales bacterium]